MSSICPCGGAWRVVDDNGVTDPKEGDRVEFWKCPACGNEKTKILKA